MDIDATYKEAISRLTEQGRILKISEDLKGLTTNHERVLYVYDIIKDLRLFPNLTKVNKSDIVATHYRNLGNQCFQKAQDYESWQYYNLSLLYSTSNSENYALALSNRSAVFYSLKKYSESLLDIEVVLTLEYPQKIKDKLINRKKLCEENFLNEVLNNCNITDIEKNTIDDYLTLKSPRDDIYVSASKKLKVVHSKEMGRHVIANEDIEVGEVLVQEDPYFNLLLKSQLLFTCSYCLSRKLNLIPCSSCCYSMFCDKKCMENAWKEYHCYECPLMPTLVAMDFTKLEWIALRTTIKAKTDSTWSELLKTVEDAESLVNTEHWGQVNINGSWVYDSKYYPSIHTLVTNIEQRSVSDIFQRCVTAAVFVYSLAVVDFFKTDVKELKPKIKDFVAGTLLVHLMTSATNMHGISTNIEDANGNFVEELSIASAPYAYHSLLNHSCAPNVVRYSKLGTGRMTLIAIRPIKKGDQLFDNYGMHHALQDRNTRQQNLKKQYKFTCLCPACVNNWPMYFNLKLATQLPPIIMNKLNKYLDYKVIHKLEKADVKTAIEMYKPLCELASDLEPYAPCKEMSDCQETLKQCHVIFEGVVPHGYSKLVDWEPIPAMIKKNPQYLNADTLEF